jgi:hypothetical protein
MALQLPSHRAYAGNTHGLVVQIIQVTLSMPAPKNILISHIYDNIGNLCPRISQHLSVTTSLRLVLTRF